MNLIHIGLPKAASTTLQNAAFISQQHFAYFGKAYHRELDGDLQQLIERISRQDARSYDAIAMRNLFHELRTRSGAQSMPVLLSHEVLSTEGRADRRLIAERLHALLAPAKVLIVVRRQEAMLQSHYLHDRRVPGAHNCSFEDWLDEYYGSPAVPLRFRVPLDYEPLAQAYEAVFGEENVVVLPLEYLQQGNPKFVQTLADLLHADPQSLEASLAAGRYNERQSQRQALVLKFQSLLPRDTNFALWGRRVLPERTYARMHRLVTGGKRVDVPAMPERWVKRIHESCARGNAALAARRKLPLAELGYPVA